MAIFDGVVLAARLHEGRVEGLIALASAPINFNPVEVETVETADIAFVVNSFFDPLTTLATVEVPASRKLQPVDVSHHCTRVRKGSINSRGTVRSVLSMIDTSATSLPGAVGRCRVWRCGMVCVMCIVYDCVRVPVCAVCGGGAKADTEKHYHPSSTPTLQ